MHEKKFIRLAWNENIFLIFISVFKFNDGILWISKYFEKFKYQASLYPAFDSEWYIGYMQK